MIGRNAGRSAAERLSERIVRAIRKLRIDVGAGEKIRVGCSVGFAFYPFLTARPRLLSWEQVVTIADRALYISKESGKDAWCGITGMRRPERGNFLAELLESPERLAEEGSIAIRGSRPFFGSEDGRIGGVA